jgi:hypothetical protein
MRGSRALGRHEIGRRWDAGGIGCRKQHMRAACRGTKTRVERSAEVSRGALRAGTRGACPTRLRAGGPRLVYAGHPGLEHARVRQDEQYLLHPACSVGAIARSARYVRTPSPREGRPALARCRGGVPAFCLGLPWTPSCLWLALYIG